MAAYLEIAAYSACDMFLKYMYLIVSLVFPHRFSELDFSLPTSTFLQRERLCSCKIGLSPPVILYYRLSQGDTYVVVPVVLYFGVQFLRVFHSLVNFG